MSLVKDNMKHQLVRLRPLLKTIYSNTLYRLDKSGVRKTISGVEATLVPQNSQQSLKLRTLDFEEIMIQDLLDEIGKDEVFYDIGGHIGMYCCFVQQVVDPQPHVFEPYTPIIGCLKQNIERNPGHSKVHEIALSSSGGEYIIPKWLREMPDMESTPGDDYIELYGLPSPDIMKIDVEGEELHTLRGLKSTLSDARLIYIETHGEDIRDGDDSDVRSLLVDAGYSLKEIGSRGGEKFFKASKPR